MIFAFGHGVRANRIWVRVFSFLPFLVSATVAQQQSPIAYRLKYSGTGDHRVHITLTLPERLFQTTSFVMPRNYPGGYNLVLYDSFVENLRAFSAEGKPLKTAKETDGPRWRIKEGANGLQRIEYDIDVNRMEQDLRASIDASKAREGYLGILGYSVFGYIDGLQHRKIQLNVEAPKGWPVLTTLSPAVPASKANASAEANDYDALADSQVLMGPELRLTFIKGKIPLFMAVYSEGDADLSAEGQLARDALDAMQAYFGNSPFAAYVVQLELLRPIAGHSYGFSQEHMNSGTFSFTVTRAITTRSSVEDKQAALFNYAHHIAHCWIPKRAYGTGYSPFKWEMPPVIDTIWFNEGFARYAAIEALSESMSPAQQTAFRSGHFARLRQILEDAPAFIREMPLLELSREASFMYSLDFRIGQNTYARGALMAAEMDTRIRSSTGAERSLRDALRFLLDWTQRNQRAFNAEELRGLLSQSTGVDLQDILARWLKPEPAPLPHS